MTRRESPYCFAVDPVTGPHEGRRSCCTAVAASGATLREPPIWHFSADDWEKKTAMLFPWRGSWHSTAFCAELLRVRWSHVSYAEGGEVQPCRTRYP